MTNDDQAGWIGVIEGEIRTESEWEALAAITPSAASEDESKVISFSNPVDPEAPAVDARAAIVMLTTAEGGLRQALEPPGPSLVFRVPGSDPVLGYTAVIELKRLRPGVSELAAVRFVGVPYAEVWQGRVFALWHGRDVGAATITQVVEREAKSTGSS